MTALSGHDHGFIIRQIRYSESSLILWWLTAGHGILKTMAKGALRPKQPFFGRSDLFYECDLAFRKSPQAQLATLTELTVTRMHPGIRMSYARVLALTYFSELITSLSEADTPVPELHGLFGKAVGYLGDHEPSFKVVERFERRLFQILGLDDGTTPLEELHSRWLSTRPKSQALLQRELAKSRP